MKQPDKYDLWAIWCHDDAPRQTSQIGKMIENAGYLTFGHAGSSEPGCIEMNVERRVSELSKQDPMLSKVISLHYGAVDHRTAGWSPKVKAKHLGLSVSKYYRLLNQAKEYVDKNINKKAKK